MVVTTKKPVLTGFTADLSKAHHATSFAHQHLSKAHHRLSIANHLIRNAHQGSSIAHHNLPKAHQYRLISLVARLKPTTSSPWHIKGLPNAHQELSVAHHIPGQDRVK